MTWATATWRVMARRAWPLRTSIRSDLITGTERQPPTARAMELCGLEPPAQPAGRSLVPLLKNPNAEWRSTAITAFNDRNISIRTERFRYIRYRDEQEELYDCTADPHEWRNLAADSDYAAAINELRASLPPLAEMMKSMPSKRGARDE